MVGDHVGVGVASDLVDVEDGEDEATDAPGEELEGDDEGEVAVCGVGEFAGFECAFHDGGGYAGKEKRRFLNAEGAKVAEDAKKKRMGRWEWRDGRKGNRSGCHADGLCHLHVFEIPRPAGGTPQSPPAGHPARGRRTEMIAWDGRP